MSTAPNLMDAGLIADPYGGYGRLREEAPVLRGVAMDGSPAWYVTRQDDVRAALADHRFVTNPAAAGSADPRAAILGSIGIPPEYLGYLTNTILDVDGIDHARVRKLVSRTFTVRRVAELRPHVEEIAAALLDGLPERVDLLAEYAYPLPITVISELVGVPEADRPAWRRWARALVTMDRETVPDAMRDMIAHCHELIARRRAEPTPDLVSGLVAERDQGDRLTDTEIVTMILTLVLAGHETTAHLISNGTLALLRHPDQLHLLRRDPSLWPVAVHELMRFCGPVHITRLRYATEDVELGGVTIHAGDAVQAVLVSANFDPRVYPDPDRLDVTRHPSQRGDGHVGFGHGAHYCLGAALARQEGEVALRALVERFPDLALDGPEPEWVPMPGSHRLKALPVVLQ
jgi:cytochrome P450